MAANSESPPELEDLKLGECSGWEYKIRPGDLRAKPTRLTLLTRPELAEDNVKFSGLWLDFCISNPHPRLTAVVYDMPHLFQGGPILRVKGVKQVKGSADDHPFGTTSNPEQKAAMAHVLKLEPQLAEFGPGAEGNLTLDVYALFPWLARLPCKKGGYTIELSFHLRNPFIGGMTMPDSPVRVVELDGIRLRAALSRHGPAAPPANGIVRELYFYDDVTLMLGSEEGLMVPYQFEGACKEFLIQAFNTEYEVLDFELDWLGHGEGVVRTNLDHVMSQLYTAPAGVPFKEGQTVLVKCLSPEARIKHLKCTLFLSDRVSVGI